MAGSFSGAITGYVARDPETAANGKAAKFSVPVSKGKDTPTTWVRVTVWGKNAEYVLQYVRKGSLVTASGTIETREFDGKSGKQVSVEMNAASVSQFKSSLDGGGGKSAAPAEDDIGF